MRSTLMTSMRSTFPITNERGHRCPWPLWVHGAFAWLLHHYAAQTAPSRGAALRRMRDRRITGNILRSSGAQLRQHGRWADASEPAPPRMRNIWGITATDVALAALGCIWIGVPLALPAGSLHPVLQVIVALIPGVANGVAGWLRPGRILRHTAVTFTPIAIIFVTAAAITPVEGANLWPVGLFFLTILVWATCVIGGAIGAAASGHR